MIKLEKHMYEILLFSSKTVTISSSSKTGLLKVMLHRTKILPLVLYVSELDILLRENNITEQPFANQAFREAFGLEGVKQVDNLERHEIKINTIYTVDLCS